jgi:PIN domain nuclease of toxin-antitoxin system
MKLLLDTHLLLWTAQGAEHRLSPDARALISDEANELSFSAASIWEIAIKSGLGRPDFNADPHLLRRALLDNDYVEIPVTSAHAAAVALLPPIHKDAIDRILVAQAATEGVTLLTTDSAIAGYAGPIRAV